jgi:hypothetical protein
MNIADMTSADTGGQSYKLSCAITNYTPNISRSFITVLDYINFPYDILRGKHDFEFVKNYLLNVDVIHCHNKYRNLDGWSTLNPNAKLLIHQHGRFPTDVLTNEVISADKVRNAFRVVSTLNLLKYVDNDPKRWIPAPFNIAEMEVIKKLNFVPISSRHQRKIRIAHSPTNRLYKNTELLIDICKRIPNVELILIEHKTHKESLMIRSRCDITFDQMHLCYGNSGLEGMCFGQPVIAGMDERVRDIIKNYIGYEPFIYTCPKTLEKVIIDLVNDKEMRTFYAKLGNDYIKEWHDDALVANRVLNIYNKL